MKKVKKISGILLSLLICLVIASCGGEKAHEHSSANEWLSDDSYHWHSCIGEECDELLEKEKHTYDNACDTKCNVCDAERTVGAHLYDNACDTKCNVCNAERTVGAHLYDNACDTACNVCGATRATTHDHSETLTAGESSHWYACSICGDKKDETAHTFDKSVAHSDYLKAAATSTSKAQYYKSCVCGKASATEYFETDKTAATLANIQDLSKTYDNVELTNPSFGTNSDGAVTFEWYQGDTKLAAKPINAGTYKVKVIIAESATYSGISVEKEFTISKKASTFTTSPAMSSAEIKYGDNYDVNYVTDGDGAVTVEYKVKDAADATYTAVAPTNKGIYTVRVSVAEGTNCTATSETVDFEIKPYVLSGLSTNVAYNGTNTHDIDLALYGYDGISLIVTFGDNGIVGSYPNGVVVLENDEPTENYQVDISTCTVNIVAKTLGVSWTDPSDLVYDGTEKLPVATLTGVFAGDDCTVGAIETVDGDNVNVGSFKSRVTSLSGADANNYMLPLNNNYKTSPEYTITQKTLTIPQIISKNYDGESSVIYAFTADDGLIGSDSCTLIFNATDSLDVDAIAAGLYENAKMSDISLSNANYKLEATTCDLRIMDTNALILQVTDVFTVQGEFVITVAVKQGTVRVGDSIVLPGTPDKVYEVLKIESFREIHESATVGEGEVGLYVDGMADVSEVSAHSFMYEHGNIPEMATEFLAEVYLKTQAEGGRRLPVTDGYRPEFRGLGLSQTAIVNIVSHYGKEDAEVWTPGETILAKITLTTPIPASLLNSLEFTMAESDKAVITGVVVDDFAEGYRSQSGFFLTNLIDTEALKPTVIKFTNTSSEALDTLEFFVSTGNGGGNYLTDFTMELYDESFVQIAGTHSNTEGTFTESDSSTWSLGAGETCYIVLKMTNATNGVFARLM